MWPSRAFAIVTSGTVATNSARMNMSIRPGRWASSTVASFRRMVQ
ncbi:hypothetical protein ACFQL1_13385 [Halomicroarcula sp. GCM10025709]